MFSDYLKALRLFNRNVRLFLVFGVLFGFGLWGIFLVLNSLYVLRLGYGPDTVGLLYAVGSATGAVFALAAGALAQRWGARRTLIAGLGVHAASVVLMPLGVFSSETWQLGWILAMWVLYGIGSGAFAATYPAFLTGSTDEEERAHAFSVWAGLVSLAAFAGGLVGGALPELFGRALGLPLDHAATFRYPLLIAGLLYVLGVLVMLATREVASDARQVTRKEVGPAPFGLIGLLAATSLLWMTGEAVVLSFYNVYLDDGLRVPTMLIGTLWAAGQLLGGLASLAAPFLMARWGKRRAIVLGALGIAAGLLPLALIPHWSAAGLGYVGLTVMTAITYASFLVFSQEAVAPGWRTTMAGATGVTYGVSNLVTGLGGGYAITALGYRPLFGLTAILPAAAALLFWTYFRVPRGKMARRPAVDRSG